MKCGAVFPKDHNIVCQLPSGHADDWHYCRAGDQFWKWSEDLDVQIYPAEDRTL